MKLATKAYAVTLLLLMLAFTVPAQRSETDARNTAPVVGSGVNGGGMTGLFTVLDGSTLQKGEYTLSFSMSNFDRDPGNADFTSYPASFQIGLTNRLELFAETEAYRQLKVNSPRNISGPYLPNALGYLNGAIVLAPGTTGAFAGQAVFRPTNSPFCAYPFNGCSAGNYQLPFSGPTFGFPANTNATLGPPRAGGNAALFPGVGSVFGSILPGVVLATVTTNGQVRPTSFTTAPSYLPDAPFASRTYGVSSFNYVTAGVKYRFTPSTSAVGVALTGYYRWYLDDGKDAGGFNQLQRGSGPGSSRGDIGAIFSVDARVASWANISGNFGYLFVSNPKGPGDFTLIDRPDELTYGVGVDFPVNKHFQPILEFTAKRYVRSRTPNAYENNPMDGLAGVRIFPRRWFGMSFAYRYNFNQQDRDSFDDTSVTQNVNIPCPTGNPNCLAINQTTTVNGLPSGFVSSTDPHGYIAQFFIGRRNTRQGPVNNIPANVTSVTLSDTVITLPCPPGTTSKSGGCNDNRTINVSTSASDAENDVLTYNYTVSGGRIVGTGANVQWDLSNAQPGTYTITTGVDDGCGVCGKTDTKTITVENCPDCSQACNCASVSVSGPSGTTAPGSSMTFTANVSGGGDFTPTYNWSVSAGTIASGQGTSSITVDTTGLAPNSNVTATVNVGGQSEACNCPREASETGGIAGVPEGRQVDEFGKATDDDVKARIDNFYIQLNNDPTARGYIINYGTPAQIRARRAQITRAINFRKYDASRVTFVDGPDNGSGVNTKLYVVPAGATEPTP